MADLMPEGIAPPRPGEETSWLQQHLADLLREPMADTAIHGGQARADSALAAFDVRGYASRRNEVWPADRRGASRLSPYIRHGLLSLPRVWDHVEHGPARDASVFRDELLWQEYARHLYARVGDATRRSLRYEAQERSNGPAAWPSGMACVDLSVGELQAGWLTNQQRMWLASQWTVRDGWGWRDGEDAFFRHLLDGSRAANRLGWQWTVGAQTGKPYGFSRWQVEKRAPGLCSTCALASACPIQQWPTEDVREALVHADPRLRRDPEPTATTGADLIAARTGDEPRAVWITAESLGDDDPALAAHPHLPVVFVWDLPLLHRLRLAPTRLRFLAECLADLSTRRDVSVRIGDPVVELGDVPLATTFAPVPGWRHRAARLRLPRVYAWPWLVDPHDGPVTSFTAWRRRARV